MSTYTDSSCMSGCMERTIAKQVHAAGSCWIVRAAGGRMLWVSAEDVRAVRPGTELLVEGGEHEVLGACCLRAILASPVADDNESLFESGSRGYDASRGARFDSDGVPLCPGCGQGMSLADEREGGFEPLGGVSVDHASCPGCGMGWELVDGRELYPSPSGRGRKAKQGSCGIRPAPTSSSVLGVCASGPGEDPETSPGVALGEVPGGTYVALANWTDEFRSELESILEGFSPHVGPARQQGDSVYWTIETSDPFAGDKGDAYASLVRLYGLISERGTAPSSFRDLRNWVSGVSF